MKKMFMLPLFLVICATLLACEETNSANQGFRAGVADVARLMRDSVPGKEGIKYLETQQQTYQKELDAIQDRLEKNPADEAAMKELQQVYAISQQRIQAEGQNVASLLFDTVQKILDTYRAEKGLDVILSQDTIASFDKKIDITAEIMTILDKQKIDFKPLPMPESVKTVPEPATDPEAREDAGSQDSPENAKTANQTEPEKNRN